MHEKRIPLRWPDIDALGHVNNALYLVFLDEGRDEWIGRALGRGAGWPNVTAHVSLDFRHEVVLADEEVIVHTELEALGRSSVTVRQEIRTPSGVVAASARTVVVAWDQQARRSRELTEEERAALTER